MSSRSRDTGRHNASGSAKRKVKDEKEKKRSCSVKKTKAVRLQTDNENTEVEPVIDEATSRNDTVFQETPICSNTTILCSSISSQ